MTHADKQRAEDARQQAEIKAKVWDAKKARIVAMWKGGEVDMATIAQAMGVTGWTVAKVLRDAGLRQPKRRKQ